MMGDSSRPFAFRQSSIPVFPSMVSSISIGISLSVRIVSTPRRMSL
ncbi:hypothetical protein BMETH_3013_0 [methanotrophic bacterial endosymbiont of Bathymodiolus sp.]|nr:hypothetical protein BMETH_3013_0 [methanotrophic bacterial endosymbiont of Bathymodiolus sp.]